MAGKNNLTAIMIMMMTGQWSSQIVLEMSTFCYCSKFTAAAAIKEQSGPPVVMSRTGRLKTTSVFRSKSK